MNKRFIVFSLCLFSLTGRADSKFKKLRPTRITTGVGLNFRPKQIYSQETYLQESWVFSGGLRWTTRLFANDLLLQSGFEKFQSLPRNGKQLGIDSVESRFSLDAGLENQAFFPIGASIGVTKISKTSKLNVGDFVINDSATNDFSESLWAPALRLWLGVPLIPQRLQINAGVKKVYMSRPADETFNYSSELRFEF